MNYNIEVKHGDTIRIYRKHNSWVSEYRYDKDGITHVRNFEADVPGDVAVHYLNMGVDPSSMKEADALPTMEQLTKVEADYSLDKFDELQVLSRDHEPR
jgi:hypothetical protein